MVILFKKIFKNASLYTIDEFGVKNYRTRYLATFSIFGFYLLIALLAYPLLQCEIDAPDANITNYTDAFWTLQMSASTIGFGDHYPVTLHGRIIVMVFFYTGVGVVGYIGALLAHKLLGFADTNVKNRELRKQNEEILKHSQMLEQKLDQLIEKIGKDSRSI